MESADSRAAGFAARSGCLLGEASFGPTGSGALLAGKAALLEHPASYAPSTAKLSSKICFRPTIGRLRAASHRRRVHKGRRFCKLLIMHRLLVVGTPKAWRVPHTVTPTNHRKKRQATITHFEIRLPSDSRSRRSESKPTMYFAMIPFGSITTRAGIGRILKSSRVFFPSTRLWNER